MHTQIIEIGRNELVAIQGNFKIITAKIAEFKEILDAIGAPPIQY